MIERVIAWSMRNRFVVFAATALFAVAGTFAMRTTPIDAIPDLSENQLIVFADWMGRSPQEVEDQVTQPLSVHLAGLAGVKTIRATSEFGFSMIDVIFDDSTDFWFARTRVQERLATSDVILPGGVVPYLAPDATATGQIFWYTVEGEGHDLGELRALQDFTVRPALASVAGVAEVASVGGMPREWQIDVDTKRLAGYGVSLGELYSAVARSNGAAGGDVVQQGNAEYLVRGIGRLRDARDIEDALVVHRDGTPIRVKDVAKVQLGPGLRRSVLEKDGREAVGGVVVMRFGENPRSVTTAIHEKLAALAPGLPEGVKVVPFYERTRLIDEAVATVSQTVLIEILIASAAIFLVMRHFGASLVVCITLPLAVLGSFLGMRALGVTSNIMSLSGIAISIGVLVDQAIVLTDNAMHRLREEFGDGRVRGDAREFLVGPCQEVGRPVFFAILVMLLSFLPVFALSGMEGKMFHPLAWTKTLALVAVGLLTITLLPAVLPLVLRGRMRAEGESWVVSSVAAVYRPVLSWLMDRPRLVALSFVAILALGWVLAGRLGSEFMPPLDEGTIVDMPVTVPRASVTQVADDLQARDALLREFPEVASVVGKAGRAETATDPSPLDMVETMVELKPKDAWPHRHLEYDDGLAECRRIVDLLVAHGVVKALAGEERDALANDGTMFAVEGFDAAMRAACIAGGRSRWDLDASAPSIYAEAATAALVRAARDRGVLLRDPSRDERATLAGSLAGSSRPYLRKKSKIELLQELDSYVDVPGWANIWTQPIVNRIDMLATGVRTMVGVKVFGKDLTQIQRVSDDVAAALRAVPGAVEVFPDQVAGENYVEIHVDRGRAARLGVHVADVLQIVEMALGGKAVTRTFDGVERAPVRIRCNRGSRPDAASLRRILIATSAAPAVNDAMPAAMAPTSPPSASGSGGMGGMPAMSAASTGSTSFAAMATANASTWSPNAATGTRGYVALGGVADVRVTLGPTMIRSENGGLRNHVQCNVRERDLVGFVDEAQRTVAERVTLPVGASIEWSGQFEHELRTRRTLAVVFPLVIALIFLVLWWTWRDLTHAALLMLAVPGAIAGGVIFQAILGHPFSTAAWVGYIACFGMATQTGVVMVVYLRKAVADAGGVAAIGSAERLREVVLDGAVRRLRPKLLTEATTILGLAPMLWATGTGAEVMAPMAAPVLGGILMADEVIDVLLPVLIYRAVCRRLPRNADSRPDSL